MLSNAVKFTERGGWIEVDYGRNSQGAFIAVRDNGIGIAPEKIHEIFEPFVSEFCLVLPRKPAR